VCVGVCVCEHVWVCVTVTIIIKHSLIRPKRNHNEHKISELPGIHKPPWECTEVIGELVGVGV